MKVLISGGAGFVGRVLSERLARDGHEVIVLSRSNPAKDSSGAPDPRISNLRGNPAERGEWQEALTSQNVIINLAGASIFSKWSPKQKRKIKESRISTTRNIVEGIPTNPIKPVTLINASAIGYYGFHQDEELDETSSPGEDFLAGVCKEWEAEAFKASAKGARAVSLNRALGSDIQNSRPRSRIS